MEDNMIINKAFEIDGIHDDELRKFSCWGSVEVVDKQGDIIPIEEIYKTMDIWMDRNAPIMFNHTNRQVGKGLNWQKADKNGKAGVLITGIIYKHFQEDDAVWEGIKKGEFTGLSFGGRSLKKEQEGNTRRLLNIAGWEFSVVPRPANQEATFVDFNAVAKSDEESKVDDQDIHSDKWKSCVEQVSADNPDVNAYAVCTAQLGQEAFKCEQHIKMVEKKEVLKQDEVVEETPQQEVSVSDLVAAITAINERLDAIEEAVAGEPEPVEEADDEEAPVVEEEKPKEDEMQKALAEISTLNKKLEELKNAQVLKSERPAQKIQSNGTKYEEIIKSIDNMSKQGKFDFNAVSGMVHEAMKENK